MEVRFNTVVIRFSGALGARRILSTTRTAMDYISGIPSMVVVFTTSDEKGPSPATFTPANLTLYMVPLESPVRVKIRREPGTVTFVGLPPDGVYSTIHESGGAIVASATTCRGKIYVQPWLIQSGLTYSPCQ